MESPAGHLGGLPDLLAFLCSLPSPDDAAEALVTGPGRVFDASTATILVVDGTDLLVIGRHGYGSTDPDSRYPVAGDLPASQAVREGVPVVATLPEAESQFADMRAAWAHAPELLTIPTHVGGPILSRGVSVGAFVLGCGSPPRLGTLDLAFIDAIGRALALWLVHPGGLGPLVGATPQDEPAITSRQLAILEALAAERTTPAIAASLACSPSTVKVEVHRLGRALGATGRADIVASARAAGLLADGGRAPGGEPS